MSVEGGDYKSNSLKHSMQRANSKDFTHNIAVPKSVSTAFGSKRENTTIDTTQHGALSQSYHKNQVDGAKLYPLTPNQGSPHKQQNFILEKDHKDITPDKKKISVSVFQETAAEPMRKSRKANSLI